MNAKRPSPLVGYNTGLLYRGTPYHVQTEDSGVDRPHVITHLFAEGGRIIATRKTSYANQVGTSAYPESVRQLIRAQHKEMIVALRDGAYDDLLAHTRSSPQSMPVEHAPAAAPVAAPPAPTTPLPSPRTASVHHARVAPFLGAEDSLHDIIIVDLLLHLDE